MHVGLDIWCKPGTPVHTPLDGLVYSCKYNGDINIADDGDYGPTIILQHSAKLVNKIIIFYTLYGHLDLQCLSNIKPGSKITAGTKIAEIGNSKINGGWPAHLHFQIMAQKLVTDYTTFSDEQKQDVQEMLGYAMDSRIKNVSEEKKKHFEEALKKIIISETDQCTICYQEFEDNEEVTMLRNCKHVFHKKCIEKWARIGHGSQHITCPVCCE